MAIRARRSAKRLSAPRTPSATSRAACATSGSSAARADRADSSFAAIAGARGLGSGCMRQLRKLPDQARQRAPILVDNTLHGMVDQEPPHVMAGRLALSRG